MSGGGGVIKNKQTGMVMLWALVILLVLLVLGVTSIRLAGLDTRIAGNGMYEMLTYQSAESSIMRTSKLYYLDKASTSAGHRTQKTGMTDQTLLGANTVHIDSDADVALLIPNMDCPVLTGMANSVDASRSAGGMDCQLYRVEAQAKLSGANAKSQHRTGIVKFIPAVP